MKKILAICAVFAALIFIVSCGDSKKNDDKTDTGESVTDEDTADSEPADAEATSDTEPTETEQTDDSEKTDSEANDNSETTDSGTDDDSGHEDDGSHNDYPIVWTTCEDDGTQGILYECADDAPCEITECPDGNSCNVTFTDCGECRNGTSKCIDGSDGIGETYTCVNGRWQKDDGKCDGSCDSEMKMCGESGCVNYTIECRDDLATENGGGAIAQCKFGKWEIVSECKDGVSCKNENSCGECRNGDTKCDDRDVDGIMNKNCDSKGDCETDSNGNTKWYPANIGVQLLCSSGEWNDDMYCPAAEGTFQQYQSMNYLKWTTEMTWVYKVYQGLLVHDDYHYSSCHNDSKNGISECGLCHNNFNICSDEKISDRPQGHIYKCQNGQIVSSQICSNKTCSSNHIQCNN